MGASYSPFAYNRPSRVYPGYGIFQAFVHIAPEKSDVIIKEIKGIAANIAARGVTEEELRRALKPTLTSIKDTLRENRYWLHTVLSGSKKYPQQLDWNRTILEGYAAITTSEISILAKQYLDNSKAATIVVKPKKNDG
jgi:zinc protease